MELPPANYLNLDVWKGAATKRSSQADRGKCPVLLTSTLPGKRGKTENWPLAIVSRQLHSAPLWSQVTGRLTFYHGNNDLFLCQGLGGLPQGARHLRRHVTVFGRGVSGGRPRTQHFDRPQKVKCVRQDARDFQLECAYCQHLCVCFQSVTVGGSDSVERGKRCLKDCADVFI